MKLSNKKPIILFDGVCNLCNGSVQFILKHDCKKQFLFASLQSDAAAKLLLQLNNKNNELKSLILIEGNKIYKKSDAVLKIARRLDPFWNVFYVFKIIPKALRDMVYNIVAKNRYKWFGKKDKCQFEIVEYKNRFINN
ncbi:MAG: DUF393 domain-containing protein [Flavobacteriaceae bacterium]|nr:DUF393 domain-containing protein [Flavobacteriaceae bacterium]